MYLISTGSAKVTVIMLGKMADFGERKEAAVSQDWWHKKENLLINVLV